MIQQIENSIAYGQLQPFQKKLVIKRDNRKQIEDAIVQARNIGYDTWAASSPMSAFWKAIVKELAHDDLQMCESCEKRFNIETMETDSDSNWFCPECWEELAPIMRQEYEELVAKGEIEPYD